MADQLPLFDTRPTPEPLPAQILRTADISACRQYRWSLSLAWGQGAPVCWIMLNPSTADEVKDDPTMRQVIYFTRAWGYKGLIVVNLYPFRTPNVRALYKWARWQDNGPDYYARDQIMHNLAVIEEKAREADLLVAAWGNHGAWVDDMLAEEVAEIVQGAWPTFRPLFCLGKTGTGAPKHPMARGVHRVPRDQKPELWRKV